MRALLRSENYVTIVAGAVAATLISFTLGSSSIAVVTSAMQSFRWVVLLALAVLAGGRVAAVGLPRIGGARVGAAALAFLAFITVSAAWSIDPLLSFEKAISLWLLGAAVLATVLVAGEGDRNMRLVLGGLLAGAAALAVGGFLLALVRPSLGVLWAGSALDSFQGLGQNPNTVAMLTACTTPLAVWFALTEQRRRVRSAAVLAALLILAEVLLSKSDGAFAGACAGLFILALAMPGSRRRHQGLAVIVAAVFVLGVTLRSHDLLAWLRPVGLPAPRAATAPPPTAPGGLPSLLAPASLGSLNSELGRPTHPGAAGRGYLSGRSEAWRGGLDAWLHRPVVGWGLGTEDLVFVDRYYVFQGGEVENSYIGTLLQLGLVGLLLLLGVIGALAARWLAVVRRGGVTERSFAAVCGAVGAAGLTLGISQSYLTAAGNIAIFTVWLSAALPVALRVPAAERVRKPVGVPIRLRRPGEADAGS